MKANNKVKWNLEKLKDKDSYSTLEFSTGVELALENLIEHGSADKPEVKWTDFKETVMLVATDTVGLKQSTLPSKPWISSEVIQTMNERRKWKAVHTEEDRKKYKSINNQLCRATDKAREMWWKEQCDEIEKRDM